MPDWVMAGLWGLVAGGTLVVGAAIAWLVDLPRTVVASVMAFGAGVLISALAFELVDEAERTAGLPPTAGGLVAGAIVYVLANAALARRGARNRKRSGDDMQPTETEQEGSGTAIAVGALLDGVPESVVLGMTLIGGGTVAVPVLAAIAISNLPEGLSSADGMRRNGRGAGYVFGVWGGIAVASGVAAAVGCLTLEGAAPATVAIITAVAAGAILAMVADTMIPEAFERTHLYAGLLASLGFVASFTLSRMG